MDMSICVILGRTSTQIDHAWCALRTGEIVCGQEHAYERLVRDSIGLGSNSTPGSLGDMYADNYNGSGSQENAASLAARPIDEALATSPGRFRTP
jgi:hypothetical protein